jgi:hypothetical protein
LNGLNLLNCPRTIAQHTAQQWKYAKTGEKSRVLQYFHVRNIFIAISYLTFSVSAYVRSLAKPHLA